MSKKESITAFENELKEKLSGSTLTNALDLISYLAANDIYPDPNDSNWFKYSGEMIYFFGLGKNLTLYSSNFNLNYSEADAQRDEAFEKYIHASTIKCMKHKGCLENPGLRREIFGQVYENRCRSTLYFKIPPLKNLPYIKKVAEMRKHDIDNMPELKRALRADINEMLGYKLKACAHDFVDYLYDKYKLKRDGDNTWKVSNGKHNLCMIQLEPGKWRFTLFHGEYTGNYSDDLAAAVHERVKICSNCHDCTSGIDTNIFGKTFKNACSQLTIQFENPRFKDYEYIRELIEYGERIAPASKSWHVHN